MPFLSRRSVDPLTPTTSFRDKAFAQNQSELPQTPRSRARSEASLFRRVSTLFTVRRRSSPKVSSTQTTSRSVGIGYNRTLPRSTLSRVSIDSTPQSSLEIRRPSGLGRRASLLGSSDPSDSESFGRGVQDGEDAGPIGFASLPNLLSGAFQSPERSYSHLGILPKRRTMSITLPNPVFRVVLEFLPRNDLPAVALVSRGFCAIARYTLYHSLDVQTLTEPSREGLYSVLACKNEIAALVVSFYCPGGFVSSVPSSDVRQALQNMYNLKSLTLPSFASILSLTPSLTFSLTHLTVLDKKLTQSQLVALRSWLATQTSLESLCLPHLVEYTNTDPSFIDDWVPIGDPSQTNDQGPFTTLLPSLKSLRASTEIVSMLCLEMNNPIQHLTLDVHETLYAGLRPSSVIRSLNGVREMHIIFAPEVDKRTVEKFLGVTGSMLTGEDKPEAIKSLEVEVSWTDEDAAETLYGIVTSIISRFRGLESLKLTSPFRSIQAHIPVSLSLLHPSPLLPPSSHQPQPQPHSPNSAPSPAWTTSSFDPPSIYAAPLPGSTIQKEFVACSVEKSYAKTWTKHCPSLSDIRFDFSCSTMDADVELCGVWFRRKMPLSMT